VSHDGGKTWTVIGQLYAAGPDASHVPGSVCGYPTIASLGDGRLACVLHTYPSPAGSDLHYLVLRDLTRARSADWATPRAAESPDLGRA
jgi:hypothetical protein